MEIPEEARRALYIRAGGQCECENVASTCTHHSSGKRCPRPLSEGQWEPRLRYMSGTVSVGNMMAMCGTCNKSYRSHGHS